MAKRNGNGITIRKTMNRVARYLGLIALIATLSACAWNLNEDVQSGTLSISLANGDGIAAQELSDVFQSLTVVVVEGRHFIDGGRTIWLGNHAFETDGPASSQIEEREPQLLSSMFVDELEIAPVSGAPEEPIPGGIALTSGINDGIPQQFTVPNLAVGREYVVWIDAVLSDTFGPNGPVRLGFSTVRIRSGADTSVAIDLREDRFTELLSAIYDRYILPFLPPSPQEDFDSEFEEVSVRFDEYIGAGEASVVIDGNELTAQFDRVDVSRFVFEDGGETYTIFELLFYPFGASPIDWVEVGITILEHGLVLEPSRGAYTFDIEPAAIPASGSIIAVDVDYFDESTEQAFFYRMLPGPGSLFGDAGFGDGIGPNSQGTFFADLISGTFDEFDWFSEESLGTASVTIENLVFNFDEIDLTSLFASEFYIGDVGPAGGYVFYVDEEQEFDWRYLEAAPFDTEWSSVPWRPTRTAFAGALSNAVGDGEANTVAIVDGVGAGNYAAALAVNLFTNNSGDWFLPSRDELGLMRDNLLPLGVGGFQQGEYYWSSSKPVTPNNDQAVAVEFVEGGSPATLFVDLTDVNETPLNARAIRAFGDDFEFIPPNGFGEE